MVQGEIRAYELVRRRAVPAFAAALDTIVLSPDLCLFIIIGK